MTRSKLLDRATGIDFGDLQAPTAQGSDTQASFRSPAKGSRTAIGSFTAAVALGRDVESENAALRKRIAEVEDANLVLMLDPNQVRPSRFANRHASSFVGPVFEEFKAEIASAGRNVQAIKVRPLPVGEDGIQYYEIVYGHRRHRACADLGIPVAAIAQPMSDAELFSEMDRENRAREDLTPWEQGVMYKRALDEKLFLTVRQLAEAIGVSHTMVGLVKRLASLPEEIIDAFPSPLEIQTRWSVVLDDALGRNREGVLAKAKDIALMDRRPDAKTTLALLIDAKSIEKSSASVIKSASGQLIGTVARDNKGGVKLAFKAGTLSPEMESRLMAFLLGMFQ